MKFKIYIASLKDYNEGRLVGQWVDLTTITENELKQIINKLSYNGNNDIAIHDYENDIKYPVSEYDNPLNLLEMVEALQGFDTHNLKKVIFLVDNNYVKDIFEAIEFIDDVNFYEGQTLLEVAEYLIFECGALGSIPESLENYIDVEAYKNTLETCGQFVETSDGVFEILF